MFAFCDMSAYQEDSEIMMGVRPMTGYTITKDLEREG